MSRYKRFCIVICLFMLLNSGWSQKLVNFKGHCGYYYQSMEHLQSKIGSQLALYDFHPGQTVGSIGAQCAYWEAAFAASTDNVTFYLEDIDTSGLNQKQVDFAWDYYSKLRGKPLSCDYKIVIGDETSTHLPELLFDKMIIINSFHEFTEQAQMLDDLHHKIKAGGILYIVEQLAQKSGEIHAVCKKRIYTDDEMISVVEKNGYKYADGLVTEIYKGKPKVKIFAFKKTG